MKEKVIIVGVNINNKKFEESMNELEDLCMSCDFEVSSRIIQNTENINAAFYVGTGKVEEINHEAKIVDAEIIIFDDELSPSQLRNLQKKLDLPILDRTALILEIFARRANTKESKLQVEVARLKYLLPRLIGIHTSLGRQGGGAGISNKGSGEKKLELDRRRIEDKLIELNKELEIVLKERKTQRRKRKESNIPLVSLVGYTNAGKSTILNQMVDLYKKDDTKKVLEKDMLFATLETSIRNIALENKKEFLISDTVGFISKLPHGLIKAFRATLEEIKEADLILHIIDYSDENFKTHMEVTKETLKEIGVENIPIVEVYNKSELILKKIPFTQEDKIYISAKQNESIKELIEIISKKIFLNYIKCEMLIPYDKGNIVSYLNKKATIYKTKYEEKGTLLDVDLKEEDYLKYKEYIIKE